MNGNRKEAGDGREADVFKTRVSKEERLQLSQRHSEFRDVAVVQLEDAIAPVVSVMTVHFDVEIDQIPKILNRGDGRSLDLGNGDVVNVQNLQ